MMLSLLVFVSISTAAMLERESAFLAHANLQLREMHNSQIDQERAKLNISTQEHSRPLAFDIGFNNGDDSGNLLDLGYRVVAVDANPQLCKAGKVKFGHAVSSSDLTILNEALAPNTSAEGKQLPFYVSKVYNEWSSFDFDCGCRPSGCFHECKHNSKCCPTKTACSVTEVTTVACSSLYLKYGVPAVLKVDIEGSEGPCLQALRDQKNKPQYVVFEKSGDWKGRMKLMIELGYTGMKIVDQRDARGRTPRYPTSSGPVGEASMDQEYGSAWRPLSSHNFPDIFMAANLSIVAAEKRGTWHDLHFRYGGASPVAAR